MEEVEKIKGYLKDLILVMANRAEKEVDAIMPGYTHVQVRCEMPVSSSLAIDSTPPLATASTTRPMVASVALSRPRILRRPQPSRPADPADFYPASRLCSTRREPLLDRPRIPSTTTGL